MSLIRILLVTLFVNFVCAHVAVAQASLAQKSDEKFCPKLFKIYTGNFGDGHFYTLKRQPDGTYGKPVSLFHKPQELPCVDGVNYYEKNNWVIISNFDMTFPELKNSKNDPVHTLNVMKLP